MISCGQWFRDATPRNDEAAVLLSRRWIQTFVFSFPNLSEVELDNALRYKVQSEVPVPLENFVLQSRLFFHQGQRWGVAFIAPVSLGDRLSLNPSWRIGTPLSLPSGFGKDVILFVSTPEGFSTHLYTNGVLVRTLGASGLDSKLHLEELRSKYEGAQLVSWAPDPAFPLNEILKEFEPPMTVQQKLLEVLPQWGSKKPNRWLIPVGAACLVVALVLGGIGGWHAVTWRQQRNQIWQKWVQETSSLSTTPSSHDQLVRLLKAQGVPVPELFEHLAKAWKSGTRILELDWNGGKLTIKAESLSALSSLGELMDDPWFANLRVDEIRTARFGPETFTIDGELHLDS